MSACLARFRDSHRRLGEAIGLLVLLGLAAALRLAGIGKESIWLDEATSLMLARMSLPELVRTATLDVHPPLYYILLHFWISLGESEAAVRGLSVVAGVLNVGLLYGLGRTLFDGQTGWIAAALLAASPLHIWYSQEARMYAWVAALMSASSWLALQFWRRGSWFTWLGYVLVTAAALYTHYYAVFGLFVINLFFVYLWARARVRDRRLIGGWIAAQAVVFALFIPWLPLFLIPITVGGEGWVSFVGKPSLEALAQTAVLYMVGSARAEYPTLVRRPAYVLFLGAFLLGLWPGRRLGERQGTGRGCQGSGAGGPDSVSHALSLDETGAVSFCLAYLVLPLGIAWAASHLLKPMYSARYMLPFLIPFLLLVAKGVRRVPWLALRMGVLLALLIAMGFGVAAQARTMDKPDWRTWSAKLMQMAQEGDLLLFLPGWQAKPFDYYARGRLHLFSDVPVPVDRYGEQALKVVAEAIAGHPRIWFIWETPHYTDRDAAVYRYLREQCRQVMEMRMSLLGRIILFENVGAAGR